MSKFSVLTSAEQEAMQAVQPSEPIGPPGPQPYRCPVCGGAGVVHPNFYGTDPPWGYQGTMIRGFIPCRACGGTGLVWGPPSQ